MTVTSINRSSSYFDSGFTQPKVESSGRLGPALRVAVQDEGVRQATGMNYDGYEQVYARLPSEKADGSVTWRDVQLDYDGSFGSRAGTLDSFAFVGVTPDEERGLRDVGAAFYLQTNQGQIWLEAPGDNYKLR